MIVASMIPALLLLICVLQVITQRYDDEVALDTIKHMNEAVLEQEYLFQYDIKNDPEESDDDDAGQNARKRRGLSSLSSHRWPLGKPINYILNGYDKSEAMTIRNALDIIERATCVRFEEISSKIGLTAYINVIKSDGCWSYVGKQSDQPQDISLQSPGCLRKDIIMHEFMHALGFWHEQSRPDRDVFVRILWENIIPKTEFNFQKQNFINSLGSNYDWKSIMHYGRKAFSKNNQPTIVLKSNPNEELGGLDLTDSDAYQIKKLYECPNTAVTKAVTSNAKETTKTATATVLVTTTTATPPPASTISTTTTVTTKPTVITTNVPTTTTTSKTSKPTTIPTSTTLATTKATSTTLKPTTTKSTTTASTAVTRNTRKTTTTTDPETSPNSKGNSCDKYSDRAPNCSSLVFLCQNKNYVIPLYCPKTCCLNSLSP